MGDLACTDAEDRFSPFGRGGREDATPARMRAILMARRKSPAEARCRWLQGAGRGAWERVGKAEDLAELHHSPPGT